MPTKRMALKRDGSCIDCDTQLPAGTKAEWDSDLRTVTCIACADARPAPPADITISASAEVVRPPPVEVPESEPSPIDVGVPGASARKEHERRQVKRERQIEEKWGTGRLGKIAKALSDDPQTTKAWKDGAVGEERVAQILEKRLGDCPVRC
jgi:hypothetical protein